MKTANEIIDSFGGSVTVAKIFGVTCGAVSQWRISGIPSARLMYLNLLRPEFFENEMHLPKPITDGTDD